MKNFPKIGIVVINYKDYAHRFLADFRDSLLSQDYPRDFFEIFLVDNASSVESRKYLKDNFSEAKILERSDGNYAAANNLGIKTAIKNNCEYIVIVNMDVYLDKSWLAKLIEGIIDDPDIGIVQSKIMLYPKDKDFTQARINSLGNIAHFLGFGFTSSYNEINKEIKTQEIIYASGSSFIMRSRDFEKIGFYNEDYYMYHDDMEVSLKVKLLKKKIILTPDSVIYHKYEFSRSVLMLYFLERNRYLIIFHFYKLKTILLILPMMIFMEMGMFFYAIINGWIKTKLKIYYYFLQKRTWDNISKTRKEIKKLKKENKVSDGKLLENFSGKILFQEIDNMVLKYLANPVLDIYWSLVKKFIIF